MTLPLAKSAERSIAERLDVLRVNPDWAKLPLFDRKGWKRVRFDEVVENLNETCDPTESGIERFIGLEHLEPGSLHIRSWGNTSDGTTFTRRCRPGQVLFGKRRAYQRKVAVAEFDAVVSGDIYVLAAKKDRLLPELLSFVCLSERFFKFAVETSAGSLSPRTNWSHIAQFEFALPPLDQQRRIAEMLWDIDQVLATWKRMTIQLTKLQAVKLKEMMLGISNLAHVNDIGAYVPPRGWVVKKAEDLVTSPITKGATPSPYLNTKKATIPFIKVYNLTFEGELDFAKDPTYVEPHIHQTDLKRSRLRPGDILMNLVGPPLGKTALIPEGFAAANVNQAIAIYRIQDEIVRPFFAHYLRSDVAQKWLERRSKKTSGQRNLTLELAQELPVPIPPPEVMVSVVEAARAFSVARRTMDDGVKKVLELQRSVINQL